jgi:hypothetical protein
MNWTLPPHLKGVLGLLIAIITVIMGLVTVSLIDDDGDGTPDRIVVNPKVLADDEQVVVLPQDKATVIDEDRNLEAREQGDANTPQSGIGLHEDLKDETPPGVTEAELDYGRERSAQLAEDQLVEPREVGGAEQVNCINRFVVNQSALSQRRVGVALHFTVSPFGSINVIHRLFNTPSFGASSNYGFEPITMECQRWVPDDRKAWCQGAFNSAYNCIEIITNNLTRAQWLATPMFKTGRLAALVRQLSVKQGTPLKLVDPVGCVAVPGITDHDRFECGNTHWDVGPGFPWDVFMRQVREGVTQFVLTEKERKLVASARKPAGTGHSRRYWCRRISGQIFWLNGSPEVARRDARLRILKRVWRVTCAGT